MGTVELVLGNSLLFSVGTALHAAPILKPAAADSYANYAMEARWEVACPI